MEFLDKIFSYPNFGTILFAVIAVLTVLFFIILFFGKKDEKERKLEETRRLELANVNAFKEEEKEGEKLEVTEPSTTEIKEIPQSNKEDMTSENNSEIKENNEKIKLDDNAYSEPVLNNKEENKEIDIDNEIVKGSDEEAYVPLSIDELIAKINDNAKMAAKSEVNNIEKGNDETFEPVLKKEEEKPLVIEPNDEMPHTFSEFASEIDRELAELKNEKQVDNSYEKIVSEKTSNVKAEVNRLMNANVSVTPINEIQKYNNQPVFSSVFAPKKEEPKEDKVTSFKIISDNENSEIENQQKKDLKEETSTVILNKNLDVALPKVKKEVPKSIELPAKKKNNEEVVHFSIIDNDK